MSEVKNPESISIGNEIAHTFILLGISGCAVALIGVSYLFEVHAYSVFLGEMGGQIVWERYNLTMVELTALGMNGAKIALIYVLSCTAKNKIKRRISAIFARVMAFVFSMLMTLLVIAGLNISPAADTAYRDAQAAISKRHNVVVNRINDFHDTQITGLQLQSQQNISAPRLGSDTRLIELNARLDVERGIGGKNFNGPKYKELQRLIGVEEVKKVDQSESSRAALLGALTAIEVKRKAALVDAREIFKRDQSEVTLENLFDSDQSQHPYMLRFVEIFEILLPNWEIRASVIIVCLGLLLSLAIEVLPMVMLGAVFASLSSNSKPSVSPVSAATEKNSVSNRGGGPRLIADEGQPAQSTATQKNAISAAS